MPGKDFRFGISSTVQGVDLNQLLVKHSLSTYFMRVAEDIPELGLSAEDVLVVDRSLQPKARSVAVVSLPEDPELKIVRWDHRIQEVTLWGVAVHVIRNLQQ